MALLRQRGSRLAVGIVHGGGHRISLAVNDQLSELAQGFVARSATPEYCTMSEGDQGSHDYLYFNMGLHDLSALLNRDLAQAVHQPLYTDL